MTIRTRILEAQHARHEALSEPRPYCRVIDIERTLTRKGIEFHCGFEVSVKFWEDNAHLPSIDCVSGVDAWYFNGQPVGHPGILSDLDTIAEQYAQNHLDELVELIEKASKE